MERPFIFGVTPIGLAKADPSGSKDMDQNCLLAGQGIYSAPQKLSSLNVLLLFINEQRQFWSSVTPRGFEPPTNRTGICHSIQLNYGARSRKDKLICAFF